MEITHEVERMKKVACPKGHGPAELPQEGNWTQVKEIRDISGLSHGIGWCAPQQGCCKLTLNVKNGVIQEALVETTGCTGATHGAAVAGEHLPGKTLLEALNTDLVCDAINVAMREIFLQLVCTEIVNFSSVATVFLLNFTSVILSIKPPQLLSLLS